jgi:hypothetical protein
MYFLDELTREKDVHVPQAKETIKLLLTTTSVRYKSICTFTTHDACLYISSRCHILGTSAKFHRRQTKNLSISTERNQEQAGLAYIYEAQALAIYIRPGFVCFTRVDVFLCVLYHMTRCWSLKTPVTLSIHFYISGACRMFVDVQVIN